MKIITGKYRNKSLISPHNSNTRPTSDKIRESMFDVLISKFFVEGTDVLDLFCGTGALGIEALSRGAAYCVFVDKNPAAIAVTRKNIAFVNENTAVYNTDWKVALEKLSGKQFDLIFVDPPYSLQQEKQIVDEIVYNGILSDDGCIVVEHSIDNEIDFNEEVFYVYKKQYSGTAVTYLSLKKEEEAYA